MEPRANPSSATSAANGAADPTLFAALPPPPEVGPDPFDPDSLRLSQDMSANVRVKQVVLNVAVRKPAREWFVRTHPSLKYRVEAGVLTLKELGESYLVTPGLCAMLADETTLRATLLVTSITKQGTLFVWPIPLPDSTGRTNSWTTSALSAAEAARHHWTRVQSDMQTGAYSLIVAEDESEPAWPDLSFPDILRLAFRDRLIQSFDHVILRQLRGRA